MKRDAILIFLFSWVFFLIGIHYPATHNFDEFHYIPSAQQWLNLAPNQNWEHPPLAKMLIAPGLIAFGDTPLGWRLMSSLFGALTLVAFYYLAFFLFKDLKSARRAAWIATLLALFNHFVFVQARIAMLDTFMMAFLIASLAYLVKALDPRIYAPTWIQTAGMLMGLAIACKWFAIIPWAAALFLLLIRAIQLKSRGRLLDIFFFWFISPLFYYYVTFVPYLLIKSPTPHTWSEILTTMQWKMWEGQQRVVTPHPYASHVWDWITLKRPMWYAFNKEGDQKEWVRGVALIGNPLIMWGGLWAILACVTDWIKNKSWTSFFMITLYGAFTACWIIIPREIAFYYYYYPAAMILTLACAYWVAKLQATTQLALVLATGVVFAWFYPILAATKIGSSSFTRWMFFDSWI